MSQSISTPILKVDKIHTHYGKIKALSGVSLHVNQGEVVSLIGANGAGKSTLLMSICGNPRVSKGKVLYNDQDITHTPTHDLIYSGIAQVPEGRRIFPRVSVFENLQLGAQSYVQDAARFGRIKKIRARKDFADDLDYVFKLFPRLKERVHQLGGTLSGGEQQMLAIARALMSHPKLLLLDEPSLGLAPMLVQQIFDIIEQINQEHNVTILLVEQNAHHALRLADRGYVMVNGKISLEGTGKQLLKNPEVKAAYLEGA